MAKRICELCDALPWAKKAERRCICHGVNIDLACGGHKQKGFVGTDIRDVPGVDLVFDAESFPWPIPDACVDKMLASHFLEHVKPWLHIGVWNEIWRVMKPSSQFLMVVPHGRSDGYIWDPTHCNPFHEATLDYFQPAAASNFWTIYRPKPWRCASMKSYQFGNIEAIMEPIKGPCPHGQTFDPEGDRGLVGLIARCTCCINLFRAKPKKQVPGTPIVGPFCRTCTSKRGRA